MRSRLQHCHASILDQSLTSLRPGTKSREPGSVSSGNPNQAKLSACMSFTCADTGAFSPLHRCLVGSAAPFMSPGLASQQAWSQPSASGTYTTLAEFYGSFRYDMLLDLPQ